MKIPVTTFVAALLAATSASAIEYNDLADAVDTAAFENADADWQRLTANRISECGVFGRDGKRRINVLVERYRALADAVSAGDESAATSAAQSLSRAINANSRFETCWNKIARREGLSSGFTRMIKKG